ncbi:hypothetical protein Cpin_5872 [Sporocytophaga myxococcoides]|uniref:Uncharacterized protein n=1 Tax=Sporocytophaga myxococcoides TaxID=153721 RepID=A0A098LC84_9BACT|nr:hypothetical protein [Sporocytophaga myxococcoides]GAL84054.1 hypothetical protein Cpin_5872 [Sporocytophaga myxococcoides]
MKILFICGSLEPGKDGVGDYTRRLAGELIRQNHNVEIIALEDQFIADVIKTFQEDNKTTIPVLRLPTSKPLEKRINIAKQQVEEFQPEYLSLQFVPYSFHRKGLPWSLGKRLKQLHGKGKWHIMFHELWLGIHGKTSKKNFLIGIAQKILIKRLIQQTRPIVTTSIPIYKEALKIKDCRLLPLFGNIQLNYLNMGKKDTDSEFFIAVHFGTFSGNLIEFEAQLDYVKSLAASKHKKVLLRLLGNGGQFKERSIAIAEKVIGTQFIQDCGILSAEEISGYFSTSDIGISRADNIMYGKSGSTIAMLEHGLPVVLKGKRPENERWGEYLPYFCEQILYSNDTPEKYKFVKEPKPQLQLTTDSFLELLKEKENKLNTVLSNIL